eukprot:3441189-Prymnesium_polylepis.1
MAAPSPKSVVVGRPMTMAADGTVKGAVEAAGDELGEGAGEIGVILQYREVSVDPFYCAPAECAHAAHEAERFPRYALHGSWLT